MKIQRPAFIAAAAMAALTISCAPHARVGVYADVPGPPSIAFEAEPYLVPLPGTYVYAVPDYETELYYADGHYWRPWEGRWYRSTYYDRGWIAFSGVPHFYTSLPRDWRNDYHSHRWQGRSWDYARVPRHEVERNWSSWKRERRWDADQRRYTGDRRWHDDDRRQVDRRSSVEREADRRGSDQRDYDRRDTDRREQSRPVDDGRREPDRREVDRRVYEKREVERRVEDGRQPVVERREIQQRSGEVDRRDEQRSVEVERRGNQQRSVEVERRGNQQRSVEVERRAVDPREMERRGAVAPGSRGMEPRPVVHERQMIERREVEGDHQAPGQGKGRGATPPRGHGKPANDQNRDGIDDSMQRP